ncbi:uncharacterized protein LOC142571827 [Dermacentor variabilis]|uniref:uncharacterized protein LOC142571827 n=1 Tax=Dermacentor variabilis TaxID=34621 RepID=UPI003F5B4591
MPDPRCGQFRFSFCSERKGGAYFDPTLASCLPVSAEIVYVCNRSPNRFSSLHECRRRCVEAARPHRRCMATPEFSHCSRELTSSMWFSNGTKCEEWRFPLGLCPARGSSVFASARQCRESCLRPRDKLQCCHKPKPHVCAFGQLKYPYFAAVGYDGCFRCVTSTGTRPKPDGPLRRKCASWSYSFSARTLCFAGASRRPRVRFWATSA